MSRILILASTTSTVSQELGARLNAMGIDIHYAAGGVDALEQLRMRSFGIVITSPDTPIDEDLALLQAMRDVRPLVRCILLTPRSTSQDVIEALRQKVFACYSAPFSIEAIADLVQSATVTSERYDEIQVVSARRGWVTLRASAQMLTADRLMTFARELNSRLPESETNDLVRALREIVLNAMEHGAAFNSEVMIELTAVRTARALVFYVRDPGPGFRRNSMGEGALAGPESDPLRHIELREEHGVRPGGYGVTLAGSIIDELHYNDLGNEVVLIKYLHEPA